MMEFTYHGIVRAGFGFYNPNHAATAIVMLLPLLWWGRKTVKYTVLKIIFLVVEFILTCGLILTFSRTGMIAYIIAASVWWYFSQSPDPISRKTFLWRWGKRCAMIVFMFLAAWYSGAYERYTDTGIKSVVSTTSRFDVWKYGLQVFHNNPQGVGAKNSGKIVTLFYNDRPQTGFRTLLNSFLTILVERGLIAGGLMTMLIVFSIICLWAANRQSKNKKLMTHTCTAMLLAVIIGAVICGSAATPFDLNTVFPDEPIYGELNDAMQAGLLVFFAIALVTSVAFGVMKTSANQSKSILFFSLTLTVVIIVSLYYGGAYVDKNTNYAVTVYSESDQSVWARKHQKEKSGTNPTTLLFPCDDNNLKDVKIFTEKTLKAKDYALPLNNVLSARGIISKNNKKRIVLCKNNVCYAAYAKDAILYKPTAIPDKLSLANVNDVYLYKWDEKGNNYLWESAKADHTFRIQFIEF